MLLIHFAVILYVLTHFAVNFKCGYFSECNISFKRSKLCLLLVENRYTVIGITLTHRIKTPWCILTGSLFHVMCVLIKNKVHMKGTKQYFSQFPVDFCYFTFIVSTHWTTHCNFWQMDLLLVWKWVADFVNWLHQQAPSSCIMYGIVLTCWSSLPIIHVWLKLTTYSMCYNTYYKTLDFIIMIT